MVFEVKKDKLFSLIFYGCFLILGLSMVLVYKSGPINEIIFPLLIVFSTLLLLIWVWYDTEYKVNNLILNLKSGPFKKNIPIRTITKLEIGKTKWIGYKLGLSQNGIVVHYNTYDEIYISPKRQAEFCKELKKIHRNIEVIEVSYYKEVICN